jgi:hypothetical protein
LPSESGKTGASSARHTVPSNREGALKVYVTACFIVMLLSLCFIDNNIQPAIAKVGRVSLVVSSVLFLITGAIALFT